MLQDVDDALRGFGVKVAGRFVRKDDVRIVDEGACDGDALLFTAGQFARTVVQACRQPECFKPFLGVFIDLIAVDAPLESGQGGVLQRGEFGEEHVGLEDEAYALFAELRQGGR